MFRPRSCLVSRGCTRVWIVDLLFAPSELRVGRIHKAGQIFQNYSSLCRCYCERAARTSLCCHTASGVSHLLKTCSLKRTDELIHIHNTM